MRGTSSLMLKHRCMSLHQLSDGLDGLGTGANMFSPSPSTMPCLQGVAAVSGQHESNPVDNAKTYCVSHEEKLMFKQ